MRADISEAMDLAELYPKKTDKLTQLLKTWQKSVGAEFPVQNPNFDATKRYGGVHPDRNNTSSIVPR